MLLTTACASYDSSKLITTGERYQPFAGAEDYRLGPGDVLGVNVYNETSINGNYTVGADGNVTLPLIGAVPAQGKTIQEFSQEAQTLYGSGYFRLPSVSVQVTEYRPIFVLGEVNRAGKFSYVPGMSALAAIATAEGFSPRAERKVLFIRREGSDVEEIFQVMPGLKVYPGDTIRVKERYF